jgi:SCY1-like protein 1
MQHVMRAFAKLQLDEEAAIRTNTTICLGKIAAHIDAQTREKVLVPACKCS